MKNIIGFAGRKRAGKTAICKHLRDTKGADIVTVADAVKRLTCELLIIKDVDELNRLKDDPECDLDITDAIDYFKLHWQVILEETLGFRKSIEVIDSQMDINKCCEIDTMVDDYLEDWKARREKGEKFTVRDVLQFVGTDVLRHYDPDWHVKKLVEAIKNSTSDLVVIDDVRFPNERKAIEDLGGDVFFVIRPDLNISVSNHSSETSLFWQDFEDNHIIINNLSLENLFDTADEYFPHLKLFYSGYESFRNGEGIGDIINPNLGSVDEDKNFVELLLKSIGSNGSIVIHTKDEQQSNEIAKKIYLNPSQQIGKKTFVFWNPYIIENLKYWL